MKKLKLMNKISNEAVIIRPKPVSEKERGFVLNMVNGFWKEEIREIYAE